MFLFSLGLGGAAAPVTASCCGVLLIQSRMARVVFAPPWLRPSSAVEFVCLFLLGFHFNKDQANGLSGN